jgi:hypothetical protein
MRDKENASNVIPVKVIVQESGGSYTATYDPPIIPVNENNAVIRFRLDSPTPDKVIIDDVLIPASAMNQFDTPVYSENRKQVELTDKNTTKEVIHLTFKFKEKHGSAMTAKCLDGGEQTDDYPQIDNNPPGSP